MAVTAVKFGPKQLFNVAGIASDIKAARKTVADEIEKDYKATVRTWKNKPTPTQEEVSDEATNVGVDESEKIYGYVDRGTRPHIIRPKRAKFLFFAGGGQFKPKTSVGVIGSSAGNRGTRDTFSKGVNHPGNKARKFTEAILQKNDRKLPKLIDLVIDKI